MQIDYCTLFPDHLVGMDLGQCCKIHDDAYAHLADKIAADGNLFICVAHQHSPLAIAVGLVMLTGVSVFGGIWYGRARRRRSGNTN